MKLFNTMTRQKEEFVPLTPERLRCMLWPHGLQLYSRGNARPMILFDVLRRYLEYRGNKVTFVQNFTDVDDKIIKRPMRRGPPPRPFRKSTSTSTSKTPMAWGCGTPPFTPRPRRTSSRSLTWCRP